MGVEPERFSQARAGCLPKGINYMWDKSVWSEYVGENDRVFFPTLRHLVPEVPVWPTLLKPEEFLSEISHTDTDTETLVFVLLIHSKQEASLLCCVVVKIVVGSGYCSTELSTRVLLQSQCETCNLSPGSVFADHMTGIASDLRLWIKPNRLWRNPFCVNRCQNHK